MDTGCNTMHKDMLSILALGSSQVVFQGQTLVRKHTYHFHSHSQRNFKTLMYGLPKNTDLSFLLGKELQSVSIARHSLVINFDDDERITITSECTYQPNKGDTVQFENYPASASLICKLLGSSIVGARGAEDGSLALEFSNGDTFRIHDDSIQYESYQIKFGSRLIVV